MKVMVIGKEHAGGTSKKTGKPFSATLVHVSYKKMHCDGAAVETIFSSCPTALLIFDVSFMVRSPFVLPGSVRGLNLGH